MLTHMTVYDLLLISTLGVTLMSFWIAFRVIR